MIRIDSYLHRAVLCEITRRWMYNRIYPGDALLVARLINFNHLYVSRYLHLFTESIFRQLFPAGIVQRPVLRKGDMKDALVARPAYRNERIDKLLGDYRAHPERYYRETPFHGTLFFAQWEGIDECIGSSRIKRARRLAEKAARRLIDRVYDSIKKHADFLADERARSMGILREELVTSPEEMQEEFFNAESRLLEELRQGLSFENESDIVISDVAGIKIILEQRMQEQLRELLDRSSDCRITEEEAHSGQYNATNLIVSYRPDKERIVARPVGGRIHSLMQARGMEPEQVQRSFADFVHTGEEDVLLEIIVSNYENTLESEIGRCIHEDRIIRQRQAQQYRGHLSKNIEYLMEYLFVFPMSVQRELTELPIKLWHRYLPDYFDEVLKQLFNFPPDDLLEPFSG